MAPWAGPGITERAPERPGKAPRGRAFAEIRLRPPVENDRRSAKPATVPVPALSRAGRAGGGRRPSCASRRYRAGSSEIPRPRCRGVSDVLALPSWVAKKIPSSFPHATDPPVRRRRSSSVVVRRASKSMHYLPAPGWDPMSLHRDGWWVSESSTPTVNSPHASWIRVALGRLDGGTLCRGREINSVDRVSFRFLLLIVSGEEMSLLSSSVRLAIRANSDDCVCWSAPTPCGLVEGRNRIRNRSKVESIDLILDFFQKKIFASERTTRKTDDHFLYERKKEEVYF